MREKEHTGERLDIDKSTVRPYSGRRVSKRFHVYFLTCLFGGLVFATILSSWKHWFFQLQSNGPGWTYVYAQHGAISFCHLSNGAIPGFRSSSREDVRRIEGWASHNAHRRDLLMLLNSFNSHYDGASAERSHEVIELISEYEDEHRTVSEVLAWQIYTYQQSNSSLGFYFFADNTNQRELLVRFPTWAPTTVVGAALVWMGVSRYRRRRRRTQCHCVSCGYNLTGNISGKCPECGTPIARTTVRAK